MRYAVFYQDTKIGTLEINAEGKHKYTPDSEGTQLVKNSISIFYEMISGTDWRDPIPFFENRIKDSKRFGNEEIIARNTDFFKLIKEED